MEKNAEWESQAEPSLTPPVLDNAGSIPMDSILEGGEGEREEEEDHETSSPIFDPIPKPSTPEVEQNPQPSPLLADYRRFVWEFNIWVFPLIVLHTGPQPRVLPSAQHLIRGQRSLGKSAGS